MADIVAITMLADSEQVVPECSPVQEKEAAEVEYSMNKDGVKLLNLFTGDDIFAHHEE